MLYCKKNLLITFPIIIITQLTINVCFSLTNQQTVPNITLLSRSSIFTEDLLWEIDAKLFEYTPYICTKLALLLIGILNYYQFSASRCIPYTAVGRENLEVRYDVPVKTRLFPSFRRIFEVLRVWWRHSSAGFCSLPKM